MNDTEFGRCRLHRIGVTARSVKIICQARKEERIEQETREKGTFFTISQSYCMWFIERVREREEKSESDTCAKRHVTKISMWKIRGHITRPSSLYRTKSNALMKWLTSNWEIQFVVCATQNNARKRKEINDNDEICNSTTAKCRSKTPRKTGRQPVQSRK